ncbi:MAG TPA: hypothetical protein VK213_13190 [Bacteroidales bacterium]|nr:hypothetical protein [Bacteroidales bacterium]
MKKIVSIPLILLILFTGITINLASHYCGGNYVASKISFSGELATCGMEHNTHKKPGINEQDHSCQDFTSAYTLSSNYVPSAVHVVDNYTHLFSNNWFYNSISLDSQNIVLNTINRPPGNFMAGNFDPEVICIFRI